MPKLAGYALMLLPHITRLASETSGNVAIIFAVTLPILIGAAGLGVETSYWYYRSLQLQSSADAAAYAGELERLSGSSAAAVERAALDTALSNGFESADGSIAVHTPPSSGPNTEGNAIEVILQQNLPRYFTAIFSGAPIVLRARAVARSQVASKACMLALDTTASKAALFSGSSDLTLTGCSVMSNSAAADSIKVQGSAKLTVNCLLAAGGMDLGKGAISTSCDSPMTNLPQAADPFIDVAVPKATGPCRSEEGATLQPGRYCSGLSLSGTVKLAAGVYIVEGGDLKVNAKAVVTGSDVTIYLACGSGVQMNGTATVKLNAPTSGDYSGILFYGDRACTTGSNTFNGTASSSLTGALYFAKQEVSYLGNFGGNGGCSQVVAGTIRWSGHTAIKQDCTDKGMRDIPAFLTVQLVE